MPDLDLFRRINEVLPIPGIKVLPRSLANLSLTSSSGVTTRNEWTELESISAHFEIGNSSNLVSTHYRHGCLPFDLSCWSDTFRI